MTEQQQEERKWAERGRGSQEFAKAGTHIFTSDELERRQVEIRLICDQPLDASLLRKGNGNTPEKAIEKLEEKFDTVVEKISTYAIPYAEAGSYDKAGALTQAFRKLSSRGKDALQIWHSLVTTPEANNTLKQPETEHSNNDNLTTKWDIIPRLHSFLQIEYLAWLRIISDYCWKIGATTTRDPIVLHQNVIPSRGGYGVDPNRETDSWKDA